MPVRVLAIARAELGRLLSQGFVVAIAACSVLVAVASILFRRSTHAIDIEGPPSGFSLLLDATRDASWPLALAGLMLGALSLSQEFSGRTLANWLLGPVRRSEVLLGKAIALLTLVATLTAATMAAGALVAYRVASFGPVTLDELVLVERASLLRDSTIGLALFAATIVVWPVVGLAIGAALRGVAPALTTCSLLFVATAAMAFGGEDLPFARGWFALWPLEFLGIARDKALGISAAYWDSRSVGIGCATAALTALVAMTASLLLFTRAEVRG